MINKYQLICSYVMKFSLYVQLFHQIWLTHIKWVAPHWLSRENCSTGNFLVHKGSMLCPRKVSGTKNEYRLTQYVFKNSICLMMLAPHWLSKWQYSYIKCIFKLFTLVSENLKHLLAFYECILRHYIFWSKNDEKRGCIFEKS